MKTKKGAALILISHCSRHYSPLDYYNKLLISHTSLIYAQTFPLSCLPCFFTSKRAPLKVGVLTFKEKHTGARKHYVCMHVCVCILTKCSCEVEFHALSISFL